MIKNIVKKANTKFVLVLIILVQVLFMLWYCNMKSGYFVDEIWSYGLSNSYYHAQIWEDGALDKTEINPQMFNDYLVVNEGEEFSYGSVIYNQTHDSHPPLFYMVLHTVSSFFPGTFSKWYGLIPNVFYFVVTIIFLYKIGALFTKNKWFPFMALLLFGFNIAAVNTVTYIRMYMLMTMWTTIFAYFHLKTILKKKITAIDYVTLFISVAGGMFTHYFFVIFAFPWVIIYLIWLGARRQWKNLISYVICGAISGGGVCFLYPTYIFNILGEREGHSSNMYNNLNNFADWGGKIQYFYNIVSGQMFGGLLTVILLLCIAGILIYAVTHVFLKVDILYSGEEYKIRIRKDTSEHKWIWRLRREYYLVAVIIITSAFYFLIVSKITTYLADRYIMCIFPLMAETFCLLMYWIFKIWKLYGNKRILAMGISILIIGGLTYYSNDPGYLYPEKKNNISISEEYAEYPCVYLYTSSYMMINNSLELVNYEKLYQLYYEDIEEKASDIKVDDSMVLYLDKEMNYNTTNDKMTLKECLKEVEKIFEFNSHTQLFEDDKVVVYYMEK